MTDNTVLVLRTSRADGTSYGGFQWPKTGYVKCDDWNPDLRFRGGLYGYLWGQGDLSMITCILDDLWQVIRVDKDKLVDLGGMVKFPEGEVVYSGNKFEALQIMARDAENNLNVSLKKCVETVADELVAKMDGLTRERD